jgi:hypothetical protein
MLAFTHTDRGLTKLIARKVIMLRLVLESELATDKCILIGNGYKYDKSNEDFFIA